MDSDEGGRRDGHPILIIAPGHPRVFVISWLALIAKNSKLVPKKKLITLADHLAPSYHVQTATKTGKSKFKDNQEATQGAENYPGAILLQPGIIPTV